ncbi:hypothetical protein V6N13_038206 [Hibiscus sabdariffa]
MRLLLCFLRLLPPGRLVQWTSRIDRDGDGTIKEGVRLDHPMKLSPRMERRLRVKGGIAFRSTAVFKGWLLDRKPASKVMQCIVRFKACCDGSRKCTPNIWRLT